MIVAVAAIAVAAWALNAQNRSDREVTSTTILNSFEEVSDLVTQKYTFSGVGQFSDSGYKFFGWDVPFTGKSFLITYSGEITAGVKFSEIDVKLDKVNKSVNVIAAEPKALTAVIDSDSVKQYDQTFNPINQLAVKDVTEFLSKATERHKKVTIDGGLLTRAKKQAEALLRTQVHATTRGTEMESYKTVFQWK